ncbi:response regulator [Azospirillum canadense]|uniref:response regulator n=1 Tax=Azospirillum canadense TaxID=403962 RepID=UPI002226C373|nr:response regulator [Azospirillum canadense]MCW2239236.1 DNA-binding NtrC family response regulator [Azospirillum canadense]
MNHSPQLSGARILVIEEHIIVCSALAIILGDWGLNVFTASSMAEGEGIILQERFNPEIFLINLPLSYPADGAWTVNSVSGFLKRTGISAPVVAMTGDSDPQIQAAAEKQGWPLLLKPFPAESLRAALTTAINGTS